MRSDVLDCGRIVCDSVIFAHDAVERWKKTAEALRLQSSDEYDQALSRCASDALDQAVCILVEALPDDLHSDQGFLTGRLNDEAWTVWNKMLPVCHSDRMPTSTQLTLLSLQPGMLGRVGAALLHRFVSKK